MNALVSMVKNFAKEVNSKFHITYNEIDFVSSKDDLR